jgi:hypothetical protein
MSDLQNLNQCMKSQLLTRCTFCINKIINKIISLNGPLRIKEILAMYLMMVSLNFLDYFIVDETIMKKN